ncbi:acyl-CoA thioesterase [Mycolicibacterium chlorophenolicum]|uniref:1,4-dihydroxy-2-naphthoyl-CoA hydrolase n=1 Tax=Mycolicibacterium chlorophenolicum TaxID=37916 RepID=A0A0J6W0Z3_9MYCO|nr:thioesterase family protein [Mycolicibacterium chlorophenolicum]KMO75408.1 1,4-dihydroxy-2-naphthoyl-CoA hydrolase [Mycolicibacterium chlorophenolicum]
MSEFSLPFVPRYAEVDQQGVVFNGHYLTWFDEAFTGLLDHCGVAYPDVMAGGLDFQVVHSEIDFAAPVRWRDSVRVTAACIRVGTTSFTLTFAVWRRNPAGGAEQVAVRGQNTYVVVSTEDWAKRPVPDDLRSALTGPGGR